MFLLSQAETMVFKKVGSDLIVIPDGLKSATISYSKSKARNGILIQFF